jgi:hypothetical protein
MLKDAKAKTSSFESDFLGWFAGLGIPVLERKHSLGDFSYYYFETRFKTPDGRGCSTHGRSQNRELAAVKAAAECIERKVLTEAFLGKRSIELPPPVLRTSNGWAVHKTVAEAQESAGREALERHLLLKAFLLRGWQGFRLVHKIESKGIDLYFLLSRYVESDKAAGMVVAKSPLYEGVSLGYCMGEWINREAMTFWEPAVYEAADKILLMNGASIDLSVDPESWILEGIKYYLETPFSFDALSQDDFVFDEKEYQPQIQNFDLGEEWELAFPLHAAFVSGGGLIPLFNPQKITAEAHSYMAGTFALHGITRIPDRIPIL